jgi:hypothetical protein
VRTGLVTCGDEIGSPPAMAASSPPQIDLRKNERLVMDAPDR